MRLRLRFWLLRHEEAPPAPEDDPRRSPDYCWAHDQTYPACAAEHEEQS